MKTVDLADTARSVLNSTIKTVIPVKIVGNIVAKLVDFLWVKLQITEKLRFAYNDMIQNQEKQRNEKYAQEIKDTQTLEEAHAKLADIYNSIFK